MRRIAYSLVIGCIAIAGVVLLARHFAAKPSDANLAEIGITGGVDQLAAPDEPAPALQTNLAPPSGPITLLPMPSSPAAKSPSIPSASGLIPTSFVDRDSAASQDNSAYRWMPLCRDPAPGDARTNPGADHMPRWNELRQPK